MTRHPEGPNPVAVRTKRHACAVCGLVVGLACLLCTAAAGARPPHDAALPEAVEGVPALPARLTLQECFLRALAANKDIRVAQLRTESSEAGIMQAEGEFDVNLFAEAGVGRSDTPVAGVPVTRTETSDADVSMGLRRRMVTGTELELRASSRYMRDRTHTSVLNPQYSPGVTLGISQDLLKDGGVGINRTQVTIARNNLLVTEEGFRDTAMRTLLEVEEAYWDLTYALADLEVRRKERDSADRLVKRAEGRHRAGDVALIEVTRAKARAASRSVDIVSAENRVSQTRNRLLQLMGVLDGASESAEFELVDAPPDVGFRTTLADALAVAAQERPDYRQANLAIANADLTERHAENQRLPTLQAFGEYSLAGLGDDLSDGTGDIRDGRYGSWRAGLRVEWPFPNRSARARHRIAVIQRRIALVQQADVLEQITREIADALESLRAAEARITRAVEARELAEQLLKAEERSFDLGLSDALDLLSAQQDLAAAERDEIGARTDYASALAALYRAQGDLLQRKGVALIAREPAAASE